MISSHTVLDNVFRLSGHNNAVIDNIFTKERDKADRRFRKLFGARMTRIFLPNANFEGFAPKRPRTRTRRKLQKSHWNHDP